MENKPCVFFFPIYPPGHLISMVEAAKNLLKWSSNNNSFSITFLLMQPPNPDLKSPLTASYLQQTTSLNLPIRFHELPYVEPPARFDGPEDFISIYVQLHLPHIKHAISTSASPVSGLVIDFFATSVIDVGNELNIRTYVYFCSNANFLALVLYLSSFEEKVEERGSELRVPGIVPIPPLSMPECLLIEKPFEWFMYQGRRYTEAKGIIVNTNIELETRALKAIAEGQCTPGRSTTPVVYTVGPVISFGESGPQEHECLKWLDQQPPKSVVFLCFGSRGTFGISQVKEIAAGLERSGRRFLWAIRASSQGLKYPTDANLEEILPEGFIERTKERGLVWPSWVPQTEILAHQSIGGFVTHCGWNSILESLWFGVPMIPWPIYAEQHLNAFVLVREMGVALDLKIDRNNGNFVDGEELERAVRCLMEQSDQEGSRVRVKAEETRVECRNAVERGGSSNLNLERLVADLGKFEFEK